MTEGSDNHGATPASDQGGGAAESYGRAARRRLLRAGLIGIPAIVTLRSRPAYALQSLSSAGIPYGLYTQAPGGKWVPAVKNPDRSKDGKLLIPDPNGPDRRPGGHHHDWDHHDGDH